MGTNRTRVPELRALLEPYDIDVNRVSADDFDENGYYYLRLDRSGRPIQGDGNRIARDHREWPSPEVYQRVVELYYGRDGDGFKEPQVEFEKPKSEEEQPKAEEPKTPIKPKPTPKKRGTK